MEVALQESPLFILKGLPGSGKTAVVLHFLKALSGRLNCRYVRLIPGTGFEALFRELGIVSEGVDAPAQALDLVRHINETPGCWVLEDLHCLEKSNAQVLLRVMQAYLRSWVVITSREEPPLSQLEAVDLIQEKLAPMDEASSVKLLEHLLVRSGHKVEDPERLKKAAQPLNGHPFLLKLLATVWAEGKAPVGEFLVREVLQGLTPEAKGFLQRLALSRIPLAEGAMVSWPGFSELNGLSQKFLVEADQGHWTVPRILADQVGQLPAEEARALHLSLAEFQQKQGEIEAALFHWLEGGKPEAAAALLEKEAFALISQGRYQVLLDSIPLLEKCGLADSPPLLKARSFVLSNSGRWEESLKVLQLLEKCPGNELEALVSRASANLNRGEWQTALAEYRNAIQHSDLAVELHTKSVHYIVLLEAFRGQADIARAVLEANPLPVQANPTHRYRIESLLCHFEGNPVRATELAQKATAEATRLHARRQVALSHQAHAEALCDLGQIDAARQAVREALDWGRRAGDAQVLGFSYLTLGRIEYEAGQALEARTAWQEAELCFLSQGHRNGAAMAHLGLMRIQMDRGQFDEKGWQRCLKAAQECGNLSLVQDLQILAKRHRSGSAPVAIKPEPETAPSSDGPWLEVQLFGNFLVKGPMGTLTERDWPTRKAAGVFALLCHGGKHGYSDQRLVTHFWPDSAEEQARSSLRSALHQVRASLKKVVQLTDSQGIQRSRKVGTVHLDVPMRLDTADQSRLLTQGEDAYLRQDYSQAIEALGAAAELYQGDFLESFRDEWTDAPRFGYKETAIKVCHLLCLSYIACKQGEAAESAARRGLQLDNLSEELHMGLMEAYLLQGLKAEALRHYRKTLQQFEDELSLYPHSFDSIFARLVI